MDYYHGTTVGGLSELKPFASPYSNLAKPCVYLTTSRQLALHYIWNTQKCAVKWPMLDIRKDGTLVFQEMFSGALAYLYKGLSGYIYHCVGEYENSRKIVIDTCEWSVHPVPVTDFEHVEDVYAKIMEYEANGMFIYEKYENLPQYRYDMIRSIVMKTIKRENLFSNTEHPLFWFFQDHFAQYWEEAEDLNRQQLL